MGRILSLSVGGLSQGTQKPMTVTSNDRLFTGSYSVGAPAPKLPWVRGEPSGRSGQVSSSPESGRSIPFPGDSQDLLWAEGGRKEGDVLYIVLLQSLSQGEHLPHAHLRQLSRKHAPLRSGRRRENRNTSQPAKPSPEKTMEASPRASQSGSFAHLQHGLPVLRVQRGVRFRAPGEVGDGVIKLSLGWDLQKPEIPLHLLGSQKTTHCWKLPAINIQQHLEHQLESLTPDLQPPHVEEGKKLYLQLQ